MAHHFCPLCGADTVKLLDAMPVNSTVQYFRCDGCCHVWVEFSDGRPIHHVTPFVSPPPPPT